MLCVKEKLIVFAVQVRAISPPRCPANRDPTDFSRIDTGRYSGGSFLMLAFKNAKRTYIFFWILFLRTCEHCVSFFECFHSFG